MASGDVAQADRPVRAADAAAEPITRELGTSHGEELARLTRRAKELPESTDIATHRVVAPSYRGWSLVVPYWLMLVARGECRPCGYSRTGNVSGVCPECGVGAPSKGAA